MAVSHSNSLQVNPAREEPYRDIDHSEVGSLNSRLPSARSVRSAGESGGKIPFIILVSTISHRHNCTKLWLKQQLCALQATAAIPAVVYRIEQAAITLSHPTPHQCGPHCPPPGRTCLQSNLSALTQTSPYQHIPAQYKTCRAYRILSK